MNGSGGFKLEEMKTEDGCASPAIWGERCQGQFERVVAAIAEILSIGQSEVQPRCCHVVRNGDAQTGILILVVVPGVEEYRRLDDLHLCATNLCRPDQDAVRQRDRTPFLMDFLGVGVKARRE